MLDNVAAEAVADEQQRAVSHAVAELVQVADEVLSARLDADLGAVPGASRAVVVDHDPRLRDGRREHALVLQPVHGGAGGFPVSPCPRPVYV